MRSSKNDLRVRMTKTMLRKGLTEIMQTKPIQTITVSEICKKVGINRSTFYAHYTDIYDLLKKIEDEMYCELQTTLNQVVFTTENSEKQVPLFMFTLFEFLKRNSDMCIILLSQNSDRRFVKKLFNNVKGRSIEEYGKVYPNASIHDIEVFYTFVASGCIGLLELWLENGMKQTPQEMATSASRLISQGVAFLR